ncbi:hypothetical protein [Opitutus terrae]|uniref:Uncharacterized protein n=1 Tax=Opitutus terrae (strain DSM 11246 / JCM 15787 / PB90-1) TaxID=452637 RepID=B1ZYY9_OPITP|nr:hypothetical protein [Opitutus terrae]ACB76312.1 hypothetical protein Oter_3032 [Opitutus terrae PB90-1]
MRLENALLIAAGGHSLAFGVFHLGFWRLFGWRTELANVSRVNRGIMQVLNLCLTFLFFAIGVLILVHRAEMTTTAIGRSLLAVMALFWIVRLVQQAIFFNLRHHASFVLSGLFLLGAALHALPLWLRAG